MHPDVTELIAFYASPLGRMVRRLLGAQLRTRWPDARQLTVAGHGYAVPVLGHLRDARASMALMPAQQGAVRWPRERAVRAVLTGETQLPLPDASVDRLIALHSVEHASDPRRLLREFWRVLSAEGRLILIVPNRRGVWARFDATPFGQGRPYSRGQLERLLTEALFHPLGWTSALYPPPVGWRLMLRSAPTYERLGRAIGGKLGGAFGGVVLVEATKQLEAPLLTGKSVPAGVEVAHAGIGNKRSKGHALHLTDGLPMSSPNSKTRTRNRNGMPRA